MLTKRLKDLPHFAVFSVFAITAAPANSGQPLVGLEPNRRVIPAVCPRKSLSLPPATMIETLKAAYGPEYTASVSGIWTAEGNIDSKAFREISKNLRHHKEPDRLLLAAQTIFSAALIERDEDALQEAKDLLVEITKKKRAIQDQRSHYPSSYGDVYDLALGILANIYTAIGDNKAGAEAIIFYKLAESTAIDTQRAALDRTSAALEPRDYETLAVSSRSSIAIEADDRNLADELLGQWRKLLAMREPDPDDASFSVAFGESGIELSGLVSPQHRAGLLRDVRQEGERGLAELASFQGPNSFDAALRRINENAQSTWTPRDMAGQDHCRAIARLRAVTAQIDLITAQDFTARQAARQKLVLADAMLDALPLHLRFPTNQFVLAESYWSEAQDASAQDKAGFRLKAEASLSEASRRSSGCFCASLVKKIAKLRQKMSTEPSLPK